MMLFKYHVVFLQCGFALAIWPRPGQYGPKIQLAIPGGADLVGSNAREMLDPKSPKSEFYERAMRDLEKLVRESTCHSVAAKVYISSCQLFREYELNAQGSLAIRNGGRLQDYMDSFAISRAICDLETAHAVIPYVCESFREPALQAIIESKGAQSLDISHEQIGQCMKGLHSDQKSWTSYNSNRESTSLLCREARLEVDKDETIATGQVVTNLFREMVFAEQQRKADQAAAGLAASNYFRSVREQVSDLKDRFFGIWNQVSEESVGVVNVLMESLRKASGDVNATNSAVKRILSSLVEGHAEHALAQENAIVATSGLVIVAEKATDAVADFRRLMEEVGYNVTEMGIALIAMEQRHAEAIDEQDIQVRELLKDVREELQDVKKITSQVRADAEKTARRISDWALDMVPAGPWGISWPLLIMTPTITVVIVGYGIPASYPRNVGLAVIGVLIAKFLTLVLNGQFDANSMTPSSLSQLARSRFSSSIVTTPVEFVAGDFSTVLGDQPTILADI